MKNDGHLAGGGAARPQYPERFTRRWQNLWLGRPLRLRGISLERRLRAGLVKDRKTGCHMWTGSRLGSGYGTLQVSTHRLAWELANGPIPDGLSVLHRCDNPGCCNPDHLFLGTQADNMADKMRKGRTRGWVKGNCLPPTRPGGGT